MAPPRHQACLRQQPSVPGASARSHVAILVVGNGPAKPSLIQLGPGNLAPRASGGAWEVGGVMADGVAVF